MKCFFLGLLAVAIVIFFIPATIPLLYPGDLTFMQPMKWVELSDPSLKAISEAILRNQSTEGTGLGVAQPNPSPHSPTVEITPNGNILLSGGDDGLLVALIPVYSDGKVAWHCLGGSSDLTSMACNIMPSQYLSHENMLTPSAIPKSFPYIGQQ